MSPTLTCFFISFVKSRRGEEGERLRLTGEGRELVGVGREWTFSLVATGGHSSLGREDDSKDSSSWHSCLVCLKLISGTSSSPSEGCLISCFGLPCLLSLEGETGVWCTE